MRIIVERRRNAQAASRCRRMIRRFFALFAIQDRPQLLFPALGRHDPGTAEKRRMVPDMLAVSTGQIGHPMSFFILMIAHDGLIHALYLPVTKEDRTDQTHPFLNGLPGTCQSIYVPLYSNNLRNILSRKLTKKKCSSVGDESGGQSFRPCSVAASQ